MIKLDIPAKPTQLTVQLISELTKEFIDSGKQKSVWNKAWLKEAVLNMAFEKCCYSEVRLNQESKYMEVEHFYPKSLYPEKVVEWGNLLPSCKKCNGTKGELDTVLTPLINPFLNNPKDHLYLRAGRYYPRSNSLLGKNSIKHLALNDGQHFVNKRLLISEDLLLMLADHRNDLEQDPKLIIPRLKRLMMKGDRKEEYSALVSTTILSSSDFQQMETILMEKSLWDKEFQDLKTELEFCSLLP